MRPLSMMIRRASANLALWFAACAAAQAGSPFTMLVPGDPNGFDDLGWSVAVSGDTAVCGAPFKFDANSEHQGSVYVFVRSGGLWSQQAKLTPSESDVDLRSFGRAVAIDGDTIVVGAHWGTPSAGAAYVFEREAGIWTQTAKLTGDPNICAIGADLGYSLAIDGDTIVAGAPNDNQIINAVLVTQTGSAYVFVRGGETWFTSESNVKLSATDLESHDNFGCSVAIDGDRIVVGARENGNAPGAAYVYDKGGAWLAMNQTARLAASDEAAGDWFGHSVALSGDTAIVGAYQDDNGNGTNKGAAYVFALADGSWAQQQKLLSNNTQVSAGDFGHSVGLSGDVATVAEPPVQHLDATTGLIVRGSVHLFRRSGVTWTHAYEMIPVDPDLFNRPWGVDASAFDGVTLLAASPLDSTGKVFAYAGIDEDCNENGIPDACDIYDGASDDANGDGVPDECGGCSADIDGDGATGQSDLGTLLTAWGSAPGDPTWNPAADLDDNGTIGQGDLGLLLSDFGCAP